MCFMIDELYVLIDGFLFLKNTFSNKSDLKTYFYERVQPSFKEDFE